MNIKCIISSHNWDGCKCSRCGTIRNEQHDWDGCKCSRCGTIRNEQHDWDGCKCSRCGTVRKEQHDWKEGKCSRCGQTPSKWDLELEAVNNLSDKSALLNIALKTIYDDVRKIAMKKLDQSVLLEIVLQTEDFSNISDLTKVSVNNISEGLQRYNLYNSAYYCLNNYLTEIFHEFNVKRLVPGNKDDKSLRDSRLKSMASKLDSDAKLTIKDNMSRNVTFTIPCGVCSYKTNVTVTIDWNGNILSGKGSEHEFRCLSCNEVFSVNKELLKEYTNRFV